jgi:purine-nucleoside phosphorylase
VPTPHINAQPGDFAPVVLLPGDPLRARHIAENHLEDVRQVTSVRNMLGFTGSHRGTPVSVMGTGMGIPSTSIYVTELICEYGVTDLIRVGSCGALRPGIELRDVVIAQGASTDSMVNRRRAGGLDFAALADFGLLRRLVEAAERTGEAVHVGNVFSADLFYPADPESDGFAALRRLGVLAVEMEAAGIFGAAAQFGARAAAICMVTDDINSGAALPSEDRETSLDAMVRITLEAIAAR